MLDPKLIYRPVIARGAVSDSLEGKIMKLDMRKLEGHNMDVWFDGSYLKGVPEMD